MTPQAPPINYGQAIVYIDAASAFQGSATNVTAITTTGRQYHHYIQPSEKGRLCVCVFDGVYINIIRTRLFGEIEIHFEAESAELGRIELPSACIDMQGNLDRHISINDKASVFAHYLERLQVVYDSILALSPEKA